MGGASWRSTLVKKNDFSFATSRIPNSESYFSVLFFFFTYMYISVTKYIGCRNKRIEKKSKMYWWPEEPSGPDPG